MNNKTVIHLCIADINELLTKALKEHVLRLDSYEVTDVSWHDREMDFTVTLEPKKAEVTSP